MYDIGKSYEENYLRGPHPDFLKGRQFPKIQFTGQPQYEFLGEKFFLPFGVPAGPLLNSKYINVSLDAGFCFPIYKTVRWEFYPCHPFPNIVNIRSEKKQLNPSGHNQVLGIPITTKDLISPELSISNSFGVPSQNFKTWQKDFLHCRQQQNGKSVGLSFQGTHHSQGWEHWKNDFLRTAAAVCEATEAAKTKLIEVNLSCPNEDAVPLFHDIKRCKDLLKNLSKVIQENQKKIIVKMGVLSAENCHKWISEVGEFIDGVSLINTIPCEILDKHGNIILGSKSRTGGVCGNLIRTAGLRMVETMASVLEKNRIKKSELGLIGVGGIMTANHVQDYLNAGAHMTQSATGMMWNLHLAANVADLLGVPYQQKDHCHDA